MATTLAELVGLPDAAPTEVRIALQNLTIDQLLAVAQRAAAEGMRSNAAAAYRWLWRIVSPNPWDIATTPDGLGYIVMYGGEPMFHVTASGPHDIGAAWDRADQLLEDWFFATYPLPMDGYPMDVYKAVAA